MVVLGSATPSLESRYNAERGKYTLLELPERIEQRPMPQVELIDMRQEFLETRKQATFSRALIDAVTERLENGEQTMLLLNRRGFSSFVACRACGERVECVNCSVTLTYHRRDRRMLCHYCNYAERVPERCPKCESEHISVHRASARRRSKRSCTASFPRRASRAWIATRSAASAITKPFCTGFRERRLRHSGRHADDRQGPRHSQRHAGGHRHRRHGLGLPDFRAAERTFQLLTQAAGRAGRGETAGHRADPDHQSRSLRGSRAPPRRITRRSTKRKCEFRR